MNTFKQYSEASARLNPQGRYILPQVETKTNGVTKIQDPYTKLFEDRIIFLGTPLDDTAADDIMAQMLVLESADPDKDIIFYINSPGGFFTAMTAVYDTMEFIQPHVNTVCLGEASSAAAILLLAGEKGKRLALPNSRIRLHQPSVEQSTRGQESDIEIQADEMTRMRSWLEATISGHSGKSVEEVSQDIERERFLSAATAVEYGLIDHVLTSRKKGRS